MRGCIRRLTHTSIQTRRNCQAPSAKAVQSVSSSIVRVSTHLDELKLRKLFVFDASGRAFADLLKTGVKASEISTILQQRVLLPDLKDCLQKQ